MKVVIISKECREHEDRSIARRKANEERKKKLRTNNHSPTHTCPRACQQQKSSKAGRQAARLTGASKSSAPRRQDGDEMAFQIRS